MIIAVEDTGGGVLILENGETVPAGFTEETTIANFDLYWTRGGIDFKKARAEIAVLVATTGFSNLSTDEKEIASKWFTVSKTDRDTVHSQAEQEANGLEYHCRSMSCRNDRITLAETLVYSRLSPADAGEVIGDLRAEQVVDEYIRHGLEGTESGDPEALYDYVEGTTGTKYASGGALPGLAHKGFTPDSGTLADLVTDIMSALKNGSI